MVRNHQSVDWYRYFKSIRDQCPWSYVAFLRGRIDIVEYTGVRPALGPYAARMYVISAPDATVEALADCFNLTDTEHEWLFSYPGYGESATPVSVLIQQNRAELTRLRNRSVPTD